MLLFVALSGVPRGQVIGLPCFGVVMGLHCAENFSITVCLINVLNVRLLINELLQ